jgi:hypothetical protein
MAASAGGATGGTLLLPALGAVVLAVPVLAVMSLAFSDFNVQVDAANSGSEAKVKLDRPVSPSGGAALGSFSGAGGGSKSRLNLFGHAAPPPPRRAEDVDVRIAPLLAEAFAKRPAKEKAPAGVLEDDMTPTDAPADAPVGRMAMLQAGGSGLAGVTGGGRHSGSGGFGGLPGSGGAPGYNPGGAPQDGPALQGFVSSGPGPSPQGQSPSPANLAPPPPPSNQAPAQANEPPAPPAGNPGPIVLRPGDVLKGDGSSVPVVNEGGQLAAGHSPGEFDTPSYLQNSGETEVEIWGLTARGVDYDYYDIAGEAIFNGGTIAFEFLDDFDFSHAFDLEFLSAGNIEFGQDFLGYTFRYANQSLLDFDELFDVFELVDDSGRERLVLSYFGPQQQQASNPQQNQPAQMPEPEVLLLFGLSLLGLAAARRRLI